MKKFLYLSFMLCSFLFICALAVFSFYEFFTDRPGPHHFILLLLALTFVFVMGIMIKAGVDSLRQHLYDHPIGLMGVDPIGTSFTGTYKFCWLISPSGKYRIKLPSWLAWRIQRVQHFIFQVSMKIARRTLSVDEKLAGHLGMIFRPATSFPDRLRISRGQTTGPSDLSVTIRDNSGNLIDPVHIEYAIVNAIGDDVLRHRSPVRISLGRYYARITIPAPTPLGVWAVRWYIQETESVPVYQTTHQFDVVNPPLTRLSGADHAEARRSGRRMPFAVETLPDHMLPIYEANTLRGATRLIAALDDADFNSPDAPIYNPINEMFEKFEARRKQELHVERELERKKRSRYEIALGKNKPWFRRFFA